jgi:hypothetical protein
MAWENPVTTWGHAGQTVPSAGDFNRIEGNTLYLKDVVDLHTATSATTSQKGHVQLSSSTSSTSTSLAATASAVKAVNDVLNLHTAEKATDSEIGHVKVDGETILVDVNGKISTPVKTRLYQGRLQYWDTVSELWRDAGMIASEPHVADFRQHPATVNTWYTVVNVSGAGVVYRISGSAVSEQNNVLQYQVVIDGVEHIFDMQAGSPQKTRGFGGDPDLVLGREYFSDILLHVKFDESLQVNIRHNSGTTVTLQCSVDFGLV